tara:strand:+ start:1273 stop:1521 length:249 start_codon:yes stop_codon:yes gene_type:complete
MSDDETVDTEMMSEAQLLGLVASDRLVYIRLLEGFKNETTSLLVKLNQDLAEINNQISVRNQALVDGGKATFVEQEAVDEEE